MILVGGFLVLVTWLVFVGVLTISGLPFVVQRHRRLDFTQFATATWWGLVTLLVGGIALSFLVPLQSPTAAIALVVIVSALGTWGLLRATRAGLDVPSIPRTAWPWFVGIAFAFAFLAVTVLGPVTHYDAGLYQVSAIRYASDFSAVPGLANLYAPLGYGNAQPVLGSLAGLGPWGMNGFRLINGLFLLLLVVEATARLIARPRFAGTAVAIAGVALVFPPMLWMADFWVASPTPDVPVLVVTIVVTAYWADAVSKRKTTDSAVSPRVLATIVLLSGLLISLRPTMIPFVLVLLLFAILLEFRRKNTMALRSTVPAIVVFGALVVLGAARDRVLSGWWLYPLSIVPFDVPWQASNPEGLRAATLGFARNPEDFQSATSGWQWLRPWLERLPDQWDPWWILAGLLGGGVLLGLARTRKHPLHIRPLIYALVPFLVGVTVWFAFTPPAFRFGWGPLFGAAALVLGWALWRLGWVSAVSSLVGLGLVAVVVASIAVKVNFDQPLQTGSWWGVEYEFVPLPAPDVETVNLDSGIAVLVPADSDQCWARYPLCTPNPIPSLDLFGRTFDQGLVP